MIFHHETRTRLWTKLSFDVIIVVSKVLFCSSTVLVFFLSYILVPPHSATSSHLFLPFLLSSFFSSLSPVPVNFCDKLVGFLFLFFFSPPPVFRPQQEVDGASFRIHICLPNTGGGPPAIFEEGGAALFARV